MTPKRILGEPDPALIKHPDCQQILSWFDYGPKNSEVSQMVYRLTVNHGLRLAHVEDMIIADLEKRRLDLEESS